jgi:low temperature requirement protein LtrA
MAASLRERWRRPPRLRTVGADDEERHATWLELFFDLVFVICIAEVVHTLEDDRTLGSFLGMAGLFVPIWWAWLGYTVYADRFDTDDLLHRVLVLAGMLAVVAMALSVHDALTAAPPSSPSPMSPSAWWCWRSTRAPGAMPPPPGRCSICS